MQYWLKSNEKVLHFVKDSSIIKVTSNERQVFFNMKNQNRLKIKSKKRVKSTEKDMVALRIVLSDGTKFLGVYPKKYDVSTFVGEAQEECRVFYEGDSISRNDALSYAKKAIAELLLA